MARVTLGRALYYDSRFSKGGDISCNTCHDLYHYGVDVREVNGKRAATSRGHNGAVGRRNSPSVYNAYSQLSQFWDGRSATIEEQAKEPITNPVEMALSGPAEAEEILNSISEYTEMFRTAFPMDEAPVSFDNMVRAIGAFERKLVTPAPIDDFLAGNTQVLSEAQVRGLELFSSRCIACHMGPGFGGAIYQKLGLLKPYPSKDEGRYEITKDENDRKMFKVPSLRNIRQTGPYFHDGSIATLEQAVSIMAEYQTMQGMLLPQEMSDLLAFFDALTGKIPEALIARPSTNRLNSNHSNTDPN